MYKPNNKKMLTVLISVTMVLSALAIIAFAATPAYAASGTITSDPTNFAITGGALESTIVVFNGGTFASSATVNFYLSSSTTFSSAVELTGSYALPAGATTMSNAVVTLSGGSGLTAGKWYLAASDGSGYTTPISVVLTSFKSSSVSPTFTAIGTTNVGTSTEFTGSYFDASASITIYLSYAGNSTVIGTTTTDSSGAFDFYANIPALSQGTYSLVAQETNSYSTTYVEGGITADSSMTIAPAITITPASTSGAAGSTFTITGTGFGAGDSIAASSPSSSTTGSDIEIGGSPTYFSAITVANDGSFTASVSLVNSLASSTGGKNVVITDLSSAAVTFKDYVYVSAPNPADLGLVFTVTPTTGSVYNVGDSVMAVVYNFPAGTPVSIYLNSVLVGKATTDSNGYAALPSTTTVPALPGSTSGVTYNAYAMTSTGLVVESASAVTIKSFYQVTDPANNMMTSTSPESIPSTGHYIVAAFGLNPRGTYAWTDSDAGAAASVLSVTVGSYSSSTGLFMPAANGTLNFSYAPGFTTPKTSTTASFTLENTVSTKDVAAYDGETFEYNQITLVSVTSPGYLSDNGAGTAGLTFTESGFIAAGTNLYPGNTSAYNVYIGSDELTIGGVTAITTSTLATLDTYTNPSLPNGVYNLTVVYNGQPVSNALFTEPVIISSAGTSVSSGGIVLEPNAASSPSYYVLVGYGFDGSDSVSGYYMTSSGVHTFTATGGTKLSSSSYGAFVLLPTTTTNLPYPASGPAGTYSVWVTASLSGSTNTFFTSYSITSNITLSDSVTTLYNGYSGDTVTVGGSGLALNQYYAVYFNNIEKTNFISTSSGAVPSGVTFVVPTVNYGNYTVSVAVLSGAISNNSTLPSTSTPVASAGFQVLPPTAITLSTDAPVAFPGQMVTFSWQVKAADSPGAVTSGGSNGPASVTVLFNGTAYTTEPAALSVTAKYGYLNGSFLMPNDPVGTYFSVSLSWAQVVYSSTGNKLNTYTQPGGAYLQLVSGNGALLTGISSTQIASLTTAVGNQITTSMKIPLSELNASVASIKGLTANITTAFGTMTTTLKTINATVASIESGQVLVQTDLGSIKTSLSSLNASITAFNGNVATISTTLGNVQTSLSSIGTQVTTNGNGIATITTDLGTLSGTVTSMNGNVGTISTTLGTLNANVTKISSPISSLEIFLIVIIVLVLITLVLSFLAINSVNRVSKKFEEQKKQ